MKKLITLLILIATVTCNAQVVMMKSDLASIKKTGEEVWEDFDVDIVISYDMGEGIFEIDNRNKDVFIVRDESSVVEALDSDGDKYNYWVLKCRDNKNKLATLIYAIWEDYDIFSLYIEYGHGIYAYHGETVSYTI